MTTPPLVAVRDLEYAWQPGRPVLSVRELSLAPGERLFVSGPSGSGKSTLLGLITGVLPVQTGQVEVLGHAMQAMRPAERDALRADHIGVIFQVFNLLSYLDVMDNVTLPCRFSAHRRQRVLAAGTDLATEARRLLGRLGLDDPELPGRPVTALSIGQQQRVAAARALLGRPELIIADEPTSSLDAQARADFVELLIGECRAVNAGIVFVSHDLSLAGHFDRQFALADPGSEKARRLQA